MNKGTAVIHVVTAMNDVLSDNDWVDIELVIAVDHGNGEVVDGDIRYDLLERRLRRDGWDVVDEDNAFTHDGNRWVAREDN